MKKYIIFPILVLALSTLACSINIGGVNLRSVKGSGEVVTEERSVSGFSELILSGIGKMIIELGDEEALTVEAEDNFMEYIETDVRGSTLEIGIREGVSLQPTEGVTFYLTVTELDEIVVSGLGDVQMPELETNRFHVVISGGGNVDIERLDAGDLDVEISGLGDLTIEDGQVDEQDIIISGGGNYNAEDLQSELVRVNISGLGSATVWAEDLLDVNISGGGDVEYRGNPSVDQSVSGLGNIKKIEE
ncbi:MAG: head GIN domain-containing protein [Anaerolineales bacterium]|jgi:hypothetical protein